MKGCNSTALEEGVYLQCYIFYHLKTRNLTLIFDKYWKRTCPHHHDALFMYIFPIFYGSVLACIQRFEHVFMPKIEAFVFTYWQLCYFCILWPYRTGYIDIFLYTVFHRYVEDTSLYSPRHESRAKILRKKISWQIIQQHVWLFMFTFSGISNDTITITTLQRVSKIVTRNIFKKFKHKVNE